MPKAKTKPPTENLIPDSDDLSWVKSDQPNAAVVRVGLAALAHIDTAMSGAGVIVEVGKYGAVVLDNNGIHVQARFSELSVPPRDSIIDKMTPKHTNPPTPKGDAFYNCREEMRAAIHKMKVEFKAWSLVEPDTNCQEYFEELWDAWENASRTLNRLSMRYCYDVAEAAAGGVL